MEIYEKIVEFDKYCPTCKNRDTNEAVDPCYTCLNAPSNIHTTQPINYTKGNPVTRKGRQKK